MAFKQLLTAITTTGASTEFEWDGGLGTFLADGVGGGAVKLQVARTTTSTWVDVGSDVTFSAADGVGTFQLGRSLVLRAVITTASTTGINASIH